MIPQSKPLFTLKRHEQPTGIEYSFGRIIAISGDHYTNRSDPNRSPICGAFFGMPTTKQAIQNRFASMVNSVEEDSDKYAYALAQLIDDECNAVQKLLSYDDSVKKAYHQHTCGIPTDTNFWDATQFHNKIEYLEKLGALYAWAGYTNADHFVSPSPVIPVLVLFYVQ